MIPPQERWSDVCLVPLKLSPGGSLSLTLHKQRTIPFRKRAADETLISLPSSKRNSLMPSLPHSLEDFIHNILFLFNLLPSTIHRSFTSWASKIHPYCKFLQSHVGDEPSFDYFGLRLYSNILVNIVSVHRRKRHRLSYICELEC